MKNVLLGLGLGALSLLVFNSCKKDKISCEDAYAKADAASEKYEADDSVENCQAFKKAALDYLNSSCTREFTAEEKEEAKEMINAMTCN